MPEKWTKSQLQELAKDMEDLIERLPLQPAAGVQRPTIARFESLTQELKRRLSNLEPARPPASYFDPSDPRMFGIFAALVLVGQEKLPMVELRSHRFYGSGVYAIYYNGEFKPYSLISRTEHPIYVGKADPKAKHAENAKEQGEQLFGRLKDHKKNIGLAGNLELSDFRYRYLVVHTGWQVAAESALVNLFKPIWNKETKICQGFGKHGDSTKTRANKRSPWDTLHPGRKWAYDDEVQDAASVAEIGHRISAHLTEHPPLEAAEDILHELMTRVSLRPS